MVWRTLTVVVAFFMGAIVSGIVVGDEALHLGRRYGVPLLVEGGLVRQAVGIAVRRRLGEWTVVVTCGLQNATATTCSGEVIRSTHLTGVISDRGSIRGNLTCGRKVNRSHAHTPLTILGGFVAGVRCSAVAVVRWSDLAIHLAALAVPSAVGARYLFRTRSGEDGLPT